MKINLNPVSHPELEAIQIEDNEFIIGRLEEPFISADFEVTADLSRRHAKIYRENEQFFIVELGSLNGTTLNGAAIDAKPSLLKHGDEIEFAKHLVFKIEILTPELDATILSQHEEVRLTLEPLNKDAGLDILVITGFPFLVSKDVGVFASFQSSFASELALISHRHAYIVHDQGTIKIADMNSTNGTFLNQQKLDDQAKVLKDNDIISFGAGGFFSYIVKLNLVQQADDDATVISPSTQISSNTTSSDLGEVSPSDVSQPDHIEENELESKTIFVNEPEIFLDILCTDDINRPETDKKPSPHNKTKNTKKNQEKPTFFNKFFIFFGQLSDALKDEKSVSKKWRNYLVTIIILASIATIGYFYLHDDLEKLQLLIKQENYAKAADLSMQLLEKDPQNNAIKDLSNKAILNTIVPDWLKHLQAKHYAQSEQIVHAAQKKYSDYPEIERAIQLMFWIGKVHRYIGKQNENGRIVIFNNEENIIKLNDFWNQNKTEHERTLRMLARNVTVFNKFNNQILSDIRTLENDQDIYISAVKNLKSAIKNKLETGQTTELLAEVTEFEKKYTAVSGLDNVKLDIHRYIEMEAALKAKDIDRVTALQQQLVFRTPLFSQFAKQTLTKQLPSEEFSKQYFSAIDLWQAGEFGSAISTLLKLTDDDWGSAALNKLERYQALLKEFNVLNKSRGTPNYVDSLFHFYSQLKTPEDDYFLGAIQADFQNNKNQAIEKAQNNINKAEVSWDKYKKGGGIGGLLRLENFISKKFKIQAGYLSMAYRNINYAQKLYRQLRVQIPGKVERLYSIIADERDTQKTWLVDLELILQPAVLKEKLSLIETSEG